MSQDNGKLVTSAVLARIEIRTWTARVVDQGASADVTQRAGATRNAANVRKNLLAGCDSTLRAVQAAAHYVRGVHRELTLPWTESERILPVSAWPEYTERVGRAIGAFEQDASALVRDYARARERAAVHLGALWAERDYPDPDEVAAKFRARSVVLPFPVFDDWRVAMADDERAGLVARARADVAERLADATRDLWDRLCTRLETVAARLDSDRTLCTSTITETRALLARLGTLNVLDDAAFSAALREVGRALVEPSAIRASDDVRAQAARKATELAASYRSMYAGGAS